MLLRRQDSRRSSRGVAPCRVRVFCCQWEYWPWERRRGEAWGKGKGVPHRPWPVFFFFFFLLLSLNLSLFIYLSTQSRLGKKARAQKFRVESASEGAFASAVFCLSSPFSSGTFFEQEQRKGDLDEERRRGSRLAWRVSVCLIGMGVDELIKLYKRSKSKVEKTCKNEADATTTTAGGKRFRRGTEEPGFIFQPYLIYVGMRNIINEGKGGKANLACSSREKLLR